MRDFLAALVPERASLLVKRVVASLRCTYPEERETAYSLQLRLSGRVRFAMRHDLILDDESKTVLFQLEESIEPRK